MGLVHPGRRHHPAVGPATRHARLGRRLRPPARARPPDRARARAAVLESGQPLPQDRAGARLSRRRGGRRAAASGGGRGDRYVTSRFAAVLARPDTPSPPGTDPEEFRLALLEDTYEVVAGLEFVTPVLALTGPDSAAEAITWPGTPVLRVTDLTALLRALHDLGADQ